MQGIGASVGIALARALILKQQDPNENLDKINFQGIDAEINIFNLAIQKSSDDLKNIRKKTFDSQGEEEAKIFDTHIMLLEDPEVAKQVNTKINKQNLPAVIAYKEVIDVFLQMFENMQDEYMSQRASDIRDISTRVISYMTGTNIVDLTSLSHHVILITDDLTPSQTASMDKNNILGFATSLGGKTSHSAIMARNMEIPAVVGIGTSLKEVQENDMILLDGSEGSVFINPSQELIDSYFQKKDSEENAKNKLKKLIGQESLTKDSKKIILASNIGTINDIKSLHENDAEGVGLYRTEFLFMGRTKMPSEEEQFSEYKKIVESLNGKQCIIRTLDIGGDKELPYLHLAKEENPFLGVRAIRLCLKNKELFLTQLRAILRASHFGPIGIMFPMIATLDELDESKKMLEIAKTQLTQKDIAFGNVTLGMMIEIPAAAILSDVFAQEVDFFSLGTNDLTQYTIAVDRMNENLTHLYNQYNPALLRLIYQVAINANKEHINLAMCGSMAHDDLLLPFWIGCGFDELSMSSMHILKTRLRLKEIDSKLASQLVQDVLRSKTSSQVKEILTKFTN